MDIASVRNEMKLSWELCYFTHACAIKHWTAVAWPTVFFVYYLLRRQHTKYTQKMHLKDVWWCSVSRHFIHTLYFQMHSIRQKRSNKNRFENKMKTNSKPNLMFYREMFSEFYSPTSISSIYDDNFTCAARLPRTSGATSIYSSIHPSILRVINILNKVKCYIANNCNIVIFIFEFNEL